MNPPELVKMHRAWSSGEISTRDLEEALYDVQARLPLAEEVVRAARAATGSMNGAMLTLKQPKMDGSHVPNALLILEETNQNLHTALSKYEEKA